MGTSTQVPGLVPHTIVRTPAALERDESINQWPPPTLLLRQGPHALNTGFLLRLVGVALSGVAMAIDVMG